MKFINMIFYALVQLSHDRQIMHNSIFYQLTYLAAEALILDGLAF